MARIVVTGYMARHPFAGNVAAFFQYVLGLRRLGHEVLYLEEKGWEWSCYEPTTGRLEQYPRTGLAMVRALFDRYCPGVPLVYVDAEAGCVEGMEWDEVKRALASCDLLLDVGGMCWLPERLAAPRRALVDIDPVFTQAGRFASAVLDDYHVHFSVGTNLGRPSCAVPTRDVDWLPLVPPIVLDLWAAPPPRPDAPFTTIATWNSYGEVEVDGQRLGQKESQFRALFPLASRIPVGLEVALANAEDDVRDEFRRAGWAVRDGAEVSGSLDAYRDYIVASSGELGVAKHAYLATHSGWLSDRTGCYLAAGRPAVLQDTGFTEWLGEDDGLLAFCSLEEAERQIARVVRDPARHAAAARRVAERVFDHRVVLPRVVDLALASHPSVAGWGGGGCGSDPAA